MSFYYNVLAFCLKRLVTGDGREKGEKESVQVWMEGCRQDLYSSGVRPAEHAGFISMRREAGKPPVAPERSAQPQSRAGRGHGGGLSSLPCRGQRPETESSRIIPTLSAAHCLLLLNQRSPRLSLHSGALPAAAPAPWVPPRHSRCWDAGQGSAAARCPPGHPRGVTFPAPRPCQPEPRRHLRVLWERSGLIPGQGCPCHQHLLRSAAGIFHVPRVLAHVQH